MNKRNILLGFLLICLIGSITAVMADNGTFIGNDQVILNESGENVTYESICVDKDRTIYTNTKVTTRDNITTKEGLIEYFIDNYWNTTNKTLLQEEIWKISENTSLNNVTYPDFYTAQKSIEGDKTTTTEEINGSNYIVTRWNVETWDFLFRMVGDGHGVGIQDLLIYQVAYELIPYEMFSIIPPEEPEEPEEPPVNETNTTNTTNTTNITIITNNTNNTTEENVVTPNPPAEVFTEDKSETKDVTDTINVAMKETGIPVLIIFVISLIIGTVVYRRK